MTEPEIELMHKIHYQVPRQQRWDRSAEDDEAQVVMRCGLKVSIAPWMPTPDPGDRFLGGGEWYQEPAFIAPCKECGVTAPEVQRRNTAVSFLLWLDRVTNPKPWGMQPWYRCGDMHCTVCGRLVSKHQREIGPGYGSCGDEILALWRLCDGSLVHL